MGCGTLAYQPEEDRILAPVAGMMTAAEVLHIRDGRIVRGELIYDAEELRRAMAAQAPANTG